MLLYLIARRGIMAYLNKNTFEVVDNIIEIDDRMVPIIQELNTKGYLRYICVIVAMLSGKKSKSSNKKSI